MELFISFFFFLGGGGKWSESRLDLISIQKALPTLNPYGSNFKAISKRRTHPSYQMIKSIIFVGCVRIYCCKDFNVCPQAAISKNKSNKILNNTSPAVRRIGLILKVRVFGNQKVASIGFKWPTKSLNEDKNSFLPKMYSYDVIYLQIRRFVEVVFYLKEKLFYSKTEHAKI